MKKILIILLLSCIVLPLQIQAISIVHGIQSSKIT